MKVLGFTLSLLLFLSLSVSTFAQTDSPFKTRIESARERIEVAKENRVAKLDGAKLRVCQVKEKVLGNRLGSLNRMSQNMLEKFDAIATRVKNFSTNKVVPAGGVVSNYDTLVADIDAKKVVVKTALASAKKTTSEGFRCDAEDPKATLTQFRTDMQAVKSALKDYRTSIKNLIVAVKSVAKTVEPSPSQETE